MIRGYRVWNIQTECYEDITEVIGVSPDGKNIYFEEPDELDEIFSETIKNNYIIELETGLKDKNGKKICEGDIVELDWYIYGDKPAYRVESEVIFDEEGVRVRNGKHSDFLKYCTGVEVIGNIHENKELLK